VLPKIAEDDEYDQEDNNLNNDQDLDENIAPYGKNWFGHLWIEMNFWLIINNK